MTKRVKAIDYKNEIIEMFNNGMSCKKIRDDYFRKQGLQVSEHAISKLLKEQGYKTGNNRFEFSDEEKADILSLYNRGLSLREICDKYGRSYNKPISILLKQSGVNVSARTRKSSNASKINEDYFHVIDTQEKAYWLGFIVADGCIAETGNSLALAIELKEQDEYLFDNFEKEIGGTNKRYYNRGCCAIRYGSLKMCSDLSKYGIVPRKSDKTVFPTIREDLVRHFIRGVFDGDGTVFLRKDSTKKHGVRLEFGFAGTESLLLSIKSHLMKDISISDNKVLIRQDRHVSQLMFSKMKDIKHFYDYIYSDSKIHLERKKAKFESFLSLYGNTEVAISK